MENKKAIRIPYSEFKEMLGALKITFFEGRDGKRGFGMLEGKCVIVMAQGLTVAQAKEREDELIVVKNPELGYFLTYEGRGGVEI